MTQQEDQTKIYGYRKLEQAEINLLNELKEQGNQLLERISMMQLDGKSTEEKPAKYDMRTLSLAYTNIQQGMMWLGKAITKPETHC